MPNTDFILLDCEYFPCIEWYKLFLNAEKVIIEQYEHFERASLRNRCYIAGPNGTIALSIPLDRGRNQRTIMKDIKITNQEKWQDLHWKTLCSSYRRSPYFEYYEESFQSLYEKEFTFLMDFNLACLDKLNTCLQLVNTFELSSAYQKQTEYADYRLTFKADNYDQINLPIKYQQVFQERIGFKFNLSMIDLLFCEGKKALQLLNNAV